MNEEKCVFCGDVIPEGRQVCLTCEKLLSGEIKNPCYKCNDRDPACHLICSKYLQWSKGVRRINNKLNSMKDKKTFIHNDRLRR